MGVSTDAKLVYGYVWEDETDLFDNDDLEWEEIITVRRGGVNPWSTLPDSINSLSYAKQRPEIERWTAEHRAELDAWYNTKKAIRAEYGVEIDRHGSDQWIVPIIKIADAGKTAARGYPRLVSATDLIVHSWWDSRLQTFAEDLGIDTSEAKGPGWFLMSWWG